MKQQYQTRYELLHESYQKWLIPVRLSHRNPPVYLLTVTFPIIFYVSPRLLCR